MQTAKVAEQRKEKQKKIQEVIRAKAVLYSLRLIDKAVQIEVIRMYNTAIVDALGATTPAIDLFEKFIEDMGKKNRLANLKVRAQDWILGKRIPKKHAVVLDCRFLRGLSTEAISYVIDKDIRTAQRRVREAVNYFAKNMEERLEITEEVFDTMVKTYRLVKMMHEKVQREFKRENKRSCLARVDFRNLGGLKLVISHSTTKRFPISSWVATSMKMSTPSCRPFRAKKSETVE